MTDKDEQIPPSVQVITRPPDDRWKPGKLRISEAVAYGNTMLPIHARRAARTPPKNFSPCTVRGDTLTTDVLEHDGRD